MFAFRKEYEEILLPINSLYCHGHFLLYNVISITYTACIMNNNLFY